MFNAFVLALLFLALTAGMLDKFKRTGFRVPKATLLAAGLAFGGAFYTCLTGIGVTNLGTTFTHSLSITPSLLVARPIIHQVVVTCTAPLQICTIGTNIITVAAGVGTLTTLDLEVQQVHSLIV